MTKRTQILCIFLIGISFLGAESRALTNEELYMSCKPLTDKGYNSGLVTRDDVACVSFVRGVLELSDFFCEVGGSLNNDSIKKIATRKAILQLKAIIQGYVNKMAASPEIWKYAPGADVYGVASKFAPCISKI